MRGTCADMNIEENLALAKRRGSPRGLSWGVTRKEREEYRKALEIAPEYASAHYHLGLALMKLSKLSAARDSFKEVVRIAPDTELGRLATGYVDLLR